MAPARPGTVPPRLLAKREPSYPTSAMVEGVTGKVRLKLSVDARGRVRRAVIARSSGDKRLDAAAWLAAQRWRYRPARRNGRAVPASEQAVVEFRHVGSRAEAPRRASRPGDWTF